MFATTIHSNQNGQPSGNYRLLHSTSPLTASAFCCVSPNPMAVAKPFYNSWREGPKQVYWVIRNELFVFEVAKVKMQ